MPQLQPAESTANTRSPPHWPRLLLQGSSPSRPACWNPNPRTSEKSKAPGLPISEVIETWNARFNLLTHLLLPLSKESFKKYFHHGLCFPTKYLFWDCGISTQPSHLSSYFPNELSGGQLLKPWGQQSFDTGMMTGQRMLLLLQQTEGLSDTHGTRDTLVATAERRELLAKGFLCEHKQTSLSLSGPEDGSARPLRFMNIRRNDCPRLYNQWKGQSSLMLRLIFPPFGLCSWKAWSPAAWGDRCWSQQVLEGGGPEQRQGVCVRDRKREAAITADTGSQKAWRQRGFESGLIDSGDYLHRLLQGTGQSPDQGHAQRLSEGTEGPADSGDMNLCQ